jgi:D-glycero-D-manno-heptose 1,7-bisphosphate phosphatase
VKRAVFFDRDGTLGGQGGFCHPDDFELFDVASSAVKAVRDAGYLAVVITNQSRVAKGQITVAQVDASFQRWQAQLEAHDTRLDAWYICPHSKADACDCKKPAPGLFLRAARDLEIDLARSFVVGDSGFNDIQAGSSIGCRTVLVRTGEGVDSIGKYRASWAAFEPDFIAEDVLEAVGWILGEDRLKLQPRR